VTSRDGDGPGGGDYGSIGAFGSTRGLTVTRGRDMTGIHANRRLLDREMLPKGHFHSSEIISAPFQLPILLWGKLFPRKRKRKKKRNYKALLREDAGLKKKQKKTFFYILNVSLNSNLQR